VSGLLIILYLFSAQSLGWLVTFSLQQRGFTNVAIEFERPGLDGLLIEHLDLTSDNISVTAKVIKISYDTGVFQGLLQTVEINSLGVRQIKLASSDQTEPQPPLSLPDLSRLWPLVPAQIVTIDDLRVRMEEPDLQLAGRARLDLEQASLTLTVNSKLLPGTLDAAAVLLPNGKLDVNVNLPGESSLLEVTGLPDLVSNQVELSATLKVTNKVFRFVQAIMENQSLLKSDLVAVLDNTPLDGSISVNARGKIPWGTNWRQLTLQVESELDITTDLPVVGETKIHGPLQLVVEDSQFKVSSTGINIKAREMTLDKTVFAVSDASTVRLTFNTQATFEAVADDVVAALTGSAQVDWHMIVSSDSDGAPIRLAESSGSLSTSKQSGQLIEDLDLQSKLTFGVENIARHQGFKNASVRGEVELVIANETATLATKQLTLAVDGIQYEGLPYLVELVSPPEIQLKLALTRGKLASLFAGTTLQAPLSNLLTSLKTIGSLKLEATVSSDDPAALLAFGSFAGGVDFNLDEGTLNLDLLENTAFDLALPSMDVGLKSKVPTRITWDHNRNTFLMNRSEWSLRIPELKLLDQRLAFRNAQLNLESIQFQSPELKLKGVARARTSRSATPLAFDILANTSVDVADFSLLIDHKVTQSLLKTELSGWRSAYDLSSGTLKLNLAGKARWQEGSAEIDAKGDISIAEGAAHYDEIKLSGLAANFPHLIAGSSLKLLPGSLSIAALDAGVPVENIKMLMQSDLEQAAISNFQADLLGARIQTSDFTYLLETGDTEFDVSVSGLPVANVLLLEGEDIKGDGILDGNLSVVLSSGKPSIPFGKLSSRPPGGNLSYQGNLPEASPGLSLAIKALRNFIYRQMDVDVNLVPNGDLNLLVKLQGHSPEVEKGRPINFKLNVSENLPALLESLQASDTFSKRVQQRLSKQPVN